ncbi:MAG: endonuclease/exonuclease/phosphatase family protein [Bradymonadia bacterium]
MRRAALLTALTLTAAGCAADDELLDDGGVASPADAMTDASVIPADEGPPPFEPPTALTVTTYNLQNLFDVVDDPSTDEGEFTPSALWTAEKFQDRIERYGAVLGTVGADVIGITEVESLSVLDALAEATLAQGGPDYAHRAFIRGRDRRGIGVAVMSVYPIVEELNRPIDLRFECTGGDGRQTLDGRDAEARPILQVDIDTTSDGLGDLTVLVSHWKSKSSGPFPCDEAAHRRRSGQELRGTVDLLLRADQSRQIIALGDFNTFEFEPPLQEDLQARMDPAQVTEPGHMYNTWGEFESLFEGMNTNSNQWNRSTNSSYSFRGDWTRLDHIIINGNLLGDDDRWRLVEGSTRTLNMAPLIQPDGRPDGYDLNSGAGYSDHFPVSIDLAR